MKLVLIVACILAALSFVPVKHRYFYIVYTIEGGQVGCLSLQIDKYPPLDSLYTYAKEANPGKGIDDFLITNIIEMPKSDFDSFTKSK